MKYLIFILTVCGMSLALYFSEVSYIGETIKTLPASIYAGLFFLMFLNIAIAVFRLEVILSIFDIEMPYKHCFKAYCAGHYYNSFLSLSGHIIGRKELMCSYGVPNAINATLVLYEKAFAFLVSGIMALVASYYFLGVEKLHAYMSSVNIIAVFTMYCLSMFLVVSDNIYLKKIVLKYFSKRNVKNHFQVIGVNVLNQFVMASSFVLLILYIQPETSIFLSYSAALIISFIAALPISINGWGVREVTSIYILNFLSIDASEAVAVSILVGILSTIIIYVFVPLSLINTNSEKRKTHDNEGKFHIKKYMRNEFEGNAVLILCIMASIGICFQVHLPVFDAVLNVNLADPLAIISFAIVVISMWDKKSLPRWEMDKLNWFCLIMFALLLFSYLRGVISFGFTQWATMGKLAGYLVLLGYMSIGYLVCVYYGVKGRQYLFKAITITVIVISIYEMCSYLMSIIGILPITQFNLNIEGFSSNRNAFAYLLIVVMILTMPPILFNNKPTKYYSSRYNIDLQILVLGWIMSVIYLTGSRAGFIVALSTIFLAIIYRVVKLRKLFLSLLVSLVIVLLFTIMSNYKIYEQMYLNSEDVTNIIDKYSDSILSGGVSGKPTSIFHEKKSMPSDVARLEGFKFAIKLWDDNKLFGAGLGAYYEFSDAALGEKHIVHNTFLWILSDFGLVGVVIMCYIFFSLIFFCYKNKSNSYQYMVLYLLLLSFLVFSLAHEILYQRIFWLILGACLAMGRMHESAKKTC